MTSAAIQASAEGRPDAVMVFWLGLRLYAVPLELVGEVTKVERVTRLPFSPPAIEGLMTLRGEAVPLVNVAALLGIDDAPVGADAKAISITRDGTTRAALRVSGIHRIQPTAHAQWREPGAAEEHPATLGYLSVDAATHEIAVVLSGRRIQGALDALRFNRGPA